MIDELKQHPKLEALPVRKAFREVYKTLLLIQRQKRGPLSPEAKAFLALANFASALSSLSQHAKN